MLTPDLWREFACDPRDPAYAGVRAGTADRNVVLEALSEAYGDGRLEREELDERTDAVHAARTLGELPPILSDLIPSSGALSLPVGPDVRSEAVAKYERSRREALMSFLTPTLICWVIWALTMPGGFAWPLFVTVPTSLGLIGTIVRKQDIIESQEKKILKKRQTQAQELPPGDSA